MIKWIKQLFCKHRWVKQSKWWYGCAYRGKKVSSYHYECKLSKSECYGTKLRVFKCNIKMPKICNKCGKESKTNDN